MLIVDIRNLDGERKSLVYDNYNKLIAATETIRKVFKIGVFGLMGVDEDAS
jgi:Vps51/Vps67